ncbi:MAG: conjugal transfer protein TraN [Rhizobacter sp.]
MNKTLIGLIAGLLMATVGVSAVAQGSTLTPAQQKAHDDAKDAARKANQPGGILSGIVSPESAAKNLPGEANSPTPDDAAAQLQFTACSLEIWNGAVSGQQLSDDCKPLVQGHTGAGKTANDTAGVAATIEQLCKIVVDNKRAPKTQLDSHCSNLLAAKKMAIDSINQRNDALTGTSQVMDVSDKTKPKFSPSQDDIKNSYSSCAAQSTKIADATMGEEICESNRTPTVGNACAKTLTAKVTWACPAGTVQSGPTRVFAGTETDPGRYTCQMQVPRDVYSCATGTTGPSNLVVPPGTQPEPACTRTSDGLVTAATHTVVQDVVTRDATYKVTDQWTSGCDSLESSTPVEWRSVGGADIAPMVGFDKSPDTNRCHLTASTCGDPGVAPRLINDVPVSRACWRYTESFDCMSTTVVNDCEANPKCQAPTDTCLEWDNFSSPPSCLHHEYRRQCELSPAVYRDQTSCENQTFCPGGTCWDTGYKSDNDFGSAISMFTGAQQAGRYFNANDFQLFKGFRGDCAHRDGLVLNCCKKNVFGDLLFDAIHAAEDLRPPKWAGGGGDDGKSDENGKPMFNDKTYDFLYAKDSTGQVAAGLRAVDSMKGQAQDVWKDIKDQDYKKAALKIFVTSPMKIAASLTNAAIDGVIELTTLFGLIDGCTEDDKLTQAKKKKNLCVDVGTHCNQKVPIVGWCWEREYRACCFNSLLAKLINNQGRAQLITKRASGQLSPTNLVDTLFNAGATSVNDRFGSGEQPNCRGFTMDQLKAIDFSKIDWSEFIATIDPKLANKDDLLAQVARTAKSCGGGGTAQCADDTPQSADADNGVGLAVDSNFDSNGNIVQTPIAKQEISLKRLLMKAYKLPYTQTISAPINNEDVRLLSKWRFRKGEPPVTATVGPIAPNSARPDCKLMGINLVRAEVTQTWEDKQIPITDANGTVTGWRAAKPGESKQSRTYPARSMPSMVNFCSDGTVPGASL